MTSLQEVHAVLHEAFDRLLELHGALPDAMRADTAFAIGATIGMLSQAKALVGRDIDDAKAKGFHE